MGRSGVEAAWGNRVLLAGEKQEGRERRQAVGPAHVVVHPSTAGAGHLSGAPPGGSVVPNPGGRSARPFSNSCVFIVFVMLRIRGPDI